MLRLLDLIFSGGYDPKKEILELRAGLLPLSDKLIKWEESELELLSLNQVDRTFSKRFANTVSGIINSIYHEHMIAYSYREFPGYQKRKVLYATSKTHEFFYIIKDESVQIYVDQYFLGYLNKDGLLYGKKKRRLIGRINDLDRPLKPIVIGDKEVAAALDPLNHDRYNPRAFEYISSNISHPDFLITLALVIYVNVNLTKEVKKLKTY